MPQCIHEGETLIEGEDEDAQGEHLRSGHE